MAKIIKVKVRDQKGVVQTKDAEEIGIRENHDRWSSVELEDGSTLRYQHPIIKVVRLIGEYDGDGNPIYLASHAPLLSVSSPEEIRKSE
jgi:hypothetical protein